MKTKHIQIPVAKNQISFLPDPLGKGRDAIYAYVKVSDLPLEIPKEVNPRATNLHSRVAKKIEDGLLEHDEDFHLLNRGMTITTLSADYNQKKEILDLEFAGNYQGLLDGAHSFSIIRKNIEPYLAGGANFTDEDKPDFLNAYVRVEVLTGIKGDLLVDLAQSRNTSAQVRDESLANLEGSFDWLKETFKDTRFGNLIAYKENEDDSKFPIDVREIIGLLTLFHPKFEGTENPPIMGYSSKGRCLEMFRDEPEGYKVLRNIAVPILEMYDNINLQFPELYEKVGGLMGSGSEDLRKSKQVKLAKVNGIKKYENGFDLYYIGRTSQFSCPDSFLYPMLASLRGIVGYRSDVARFKTNPEEFFNKVGKTLVKMTLETTKELGRNVNAVGKSQSHWIALFEKVSNLYLRSITTEKE